MAEPKVADDTVRLKLKLFLQFLQQGTARLNSLRSQGTLVLASSLVILVLALDLEPCVHCIEVIGQVLIWLSAASAAVGLMCLHNLGEVPPAKLLDVEDADLGAMSSHFREVKCRVEEQRNIMTCSQRWFTAAIWFLVGGTLFLVFGGAA